MIAFAAAAIFLGVMAIGTSREYLADIAYLNNPSVIILESAQLDVRSTSDDEIYYVKGTTSEGEEASFVISSAQYWSHRDSKLVNVRVSYLPNSRHLLSIDL